MYWANDSQRTLMTYSTFGLLTINYSQRSNAFQKKNYKKLQEYNQVIFALFQMLQIKFMKFLKMSICAVKCLHDKEATVCCMLESRKSS
jgi:hypothetical protein